MIHYEQQGPRDGEVLLLSSGLGGSASYWADHLAAFSQRYRVVTYDQRGTGRSAEALPDPTSIEAMAEDVAWVLDRIGAQRCHFIGHALGGLIGVALAAALPERISALVIINGWIRPDPHTQRCFDVRRDLLRAVGPAAFIRAQPLFLYPSRWMASHAERLARDETHALHHFAGVDNSLRRIAALLAFDATGFLHRLRARTLLIVSEDDLLVPPLCSEDLHAALPGSQLARLDGGHACNITDPAGFERLCLEFLG